MQAYAHACRLAHARNHTIIRTCARARTRAQNRRDGRHPSSNIPRHASESGVTCTCVEMRCWENHIACDILHCATRTCAETRRWGNDDPITCVRSNHTAVSRHMRNDDAMHTHRQKVHLRPCEPHCRQQMLIDDGEILPPPLYRPQKAQRIRHQVP